MMNVSTTIKVAISLLVAAALVATHLNSSSDVSDESIIPLCRHIHVFIADCWIVIDNSAGTIPYVTFLWGFFRERAQIHMESSRSTLELSNVSFANLQLVLYSEHYIADEFSGDDEEQSSQGIQEVAIWRVNIRRRRWERYRNK
jgi:hypothetical protein